jgi:RNA polymerase sigma-70 factor, ECF subfamily
MGVAEHEFLDSTPSSMPSSTDESRLVDALRHGDEAAFLILVERYHHALVRLALAFAPNQTAAEEAVQETWLDVLQGVLRIEGRASLKLWIFRLLVDRLMARGEYVPFALEADAASSAPAVQPERFLPPDHPKWPGHWAAFPQSWADVPESWLWGRDTCEQIETTIEVLPPHQRAIICLRDVEHWTAEEVAHVLGIGRAQQCLLLHQARSVVRGVLETWLDKG